MPTYPTSRDYDLLLRLMPTHRIVCFVDDGYGHRDPCATRYVGPSHYNDGRPEPWIKVSNPHRSYMAGRRAAEDFKQRCAAVNLEFILPPPAVNEVTPVNPVPLKHHGDALLHS